MTKLWHDDVRPPPDGDDWVRARTNHEAMTLLSHGGIDECSLDHDMGADPSAGINAKGSSPNGSGLDLVRWMVEQNLVPPIVTIHSWNYYGAQAMASELRRAGHACIVRPFST